MNARVRKRFLIAATRLFPRQGCSGAGVKQIVTKSAPTGLLSNFLPAGTPGPALSAVARNAPRCRELLDRMFAQTTDTGQAVINWFSWAARTLEESDFAYCPIAALACEVPSTIDALPTARQVVFDLWRSRLVAEGAKPARAHRLATFAMAGLEGATMLGRIQRSTEPLRDTGRIVAETLRAAFRADTAAEDNPA